jgi:hypothetical protein
MKKEELQSILGDGENAPDLGPIENYLDSIATERKLPDRAIAICTIRIEESAPILRAVLVRAANGEELSDEAGMLLFRGLHILGAARDREACQPLLRLLRRPSLEIDILLGDTITESMAKIVTSVFDGDAEALFALIADRSIEQFIREALLGAATFLAWERHIERDQMRRFLVRFHDERMAKNGDQAWVGWLQAIALLGLRDLAPLVDRAWHDGRIPEEFIDRQDFDDDLADAEHTPDDVDRFERLNLGYIKDALESLDWTRRYEDSAKEDDAEWPYGEKLWPDLVPGPTEPVRNPWRHVGRNDPCPCGSGKKAKKCCLSGGQPPT